MSVRSLLRAVARLAIVASVALSGVTFGADDAEARRGGKVRSSSSHTKPHDGGEATRKTGDTEDGSAASHGGSYVPGVRVRSRETSRGGETTTDAGRAASRRQSPIPAGASGMNAIKDIDVPGCAPGMICTVCLAGCEGSVNSIVDAQVKTPEPRSRE
jgi:hypothetical protein